ncbi:Ca-activated chloride channel family protein [Elusimicrobium posterum]|uniref:tetratricopeptide repeat protein n=1 Tax=Elusimicrobium posterum TaxID=3116653 RepID=UPI003C709AE4
MKKFFIFFTFSVFCFFSAVDANARSEGELLIKGAKQYKKTKYGAALTTFEEAQQKAPESDKPVYNKAAALYKLKEYKDAIGFYKQISETQDSELRQNSYYNLGNALYLTGDRDGAQAAYKQAVLMNPKDKQAIHNLQLLLKEKKEDEEDEKKAEEECEEEKDSEHDKQNNNNEGQGQGQNQDQEQNNREMDKEDAARLIQMMREQEENAPGREEKQYGQGLYEVEKDW